MKKILLLIAVVLLFAGCSKRMYNYPTGKNMIKVRKYNHVNMCRTYHDVIFDQYKKK